jgi:amino acid adenylation domain-containing protein
VHDLVAAVAARSPDAIAVVGAARTLTFRELDERANGLARQLLASGVRGDTAVAVYAHRSPELVIALLAVLKAGAAYFPVDPAYPPDRVASAIRSSRSPVILTEAGLAAGLPRTDSGGEWPHLLLGQEPRCPDAPDVSVDPLSLAYVIYTSGSTGTPKSAMLTHEALRNLCSWLQRFFGHGPADRVAMLASVSFDGLAWEIWPHLSVGAALCVVDDRTRAVPSELVAFFARQRITRCFLPTGLAQVMAEQEWPPDAALKVVFAGGDRLHWPSRSRSWLLYNHYGPTEATVVMTGTLAEPGPGKRDAPTLGRAIDNVQAYVLDANLELLPIGVPGELHIGGACLGRGYAGMPGLTADSWIPDPFGPPGGVLYRTGDIVRLLPDGDLDFVSRADQQVKIRGYRVEPGEIEAVCRKHPLVADALVLAVDTPASGRQLTAYLAGDLPEQGVAEVRGFVREQLPDYMVPARWHVLAAFPLTSNGKVDHRALPAAARDGAYRQAALVPREATGRQSVQQRVARVWEAVLGTSQLMPEDSFFEVGGNSLLLTKLAECLRTEFAVPVGLMDIFACPTIATQAEFLDKASGQPAPDRGPSQGGTAAGDVASARLAARQRRAQRRGGTE